MTRRAGMVLENSHSYDHGRATGHRSTHIDLPILPSNTLLLALF